MQLESPLGLLIRRCRINSHTPCPAAFPPLFAEGVQLDSPLGLLIRRCRINFRLMPFEAVAALHARIGAALAALPSVTDMLQGQGAGLQGSGQAGVAGVDGGVDGGVSLLLTRLRSQHQVEAVLSQRLQRLQCQVRDGYGWNLMVRDGDRVAFMVGFGEC